MRRLAMVLVVMLAAAGGAALAREPEGGSPPAGADRDGRRVFQRFVEDAAIVPGGWIEGRLVYANLPNGESAFAGPLIAFRLGDSVEAGLRFGFIDVDPDVGSGGSGFSDVDLFLKYRAPRSGPHRAAFGALVKAPTADEEDGIGTGETDVEVFAAYRANLPAVTLAFNAGARLNGDPPGVDVEETILLGAGILMPATHRLTFLIEGSWETERFDGAGNDGRLTTGLQLMGHGGRGGFRAAVALPLTDAAPDYEVIVGALFSY